MFPFLNEFALRPFRELERVQRRFDRFSPSIAAESAVPINLHANEQGAAVVARIPGWEVEWLDIAVEGRSLSLKGEVPEGVAEATTLLRSFQRIVHLPFDIEPESVKASYRQGLLTITLERPEKEKPRTIQVQVA